MHRGSSEGGLVSLKAVSPLLTNEAPADKALDK